MAKRVVTVPAKADTNCGTLADTAGKAARKEAKEEKAEERRAMERPTLSRTIMVIGGHLTATNGQQKAVAVRPEEHILRPDCAA